MTKNEEVKNSEPEVPLITIVSSGTQTKGFEITDIIKPNLNYNCLKSQSPASGRASPNDPEELNKVGVTEKVISSK